MVKAGVIPRVLPRNFIGLVEMLDVLPSFNTKVVRGRCLEPSKQYEMHLSSRVGADYKALIMITA